MEYTIEMIKTDLSKLDVKQFYKKYIMKSDNWYFRNVLEIPQESIIDVFDDFRDIVSTNLEVDFNSVIMVGSGKIGYSLSPKKKFKQFELDAESDNKSDIDIAIISPEIFDYFWRLFRKSYNVKNSYTYKYISREIYRGYINDRNLEEIEECRVIWNKLSKKCNKKLKSNMYFRHDITYRIYRKWKDFEEYNLLSIEAMKDEVNKNGF